MLNVAGGLIIEHPLILPFVKQVVSLLHFCTHYQKSRFVITKRKKKTKLA